MAENQTRNIILVGFMGSGKTTLGKKMALKFGYQFVDMDAEIEKLEGQTISEIFKNKGENYFRQKENEYLLSLKPNSKLVISTGGGTPCFFNNMEIINQIGISIFIDLPPSTLMQRLENEKNKRPLIQSLAGNDLLNFIAEKLELRIPFYQKAKIHFYPLKVKESDFLEVLSTQV